MPVETEGAAERSNETLVIKLSDPTILATYNKPYTCIRSGREFKIENVPPCYENEDLQYKCAVCNIEQQVRTKYSRGPDGNISQHQLQLRKDLHIGMKRFIMHGCKRAPAKPLKSFENDGGIFMGLEPEEERQKEFLSDVGIRMRREYTDDGWVLKRVNPNESRFSAAEQRENDELLIDSFNRLIPDNFIQKNLTDLVNVALLELMKNPSCVRTHIPIENNEIPPCYWGRHFKNPCHVCRIECASLRTEPNCYRKKKPLRGSQIQKKVMLMDVWMSYLMQDAFLFDQFGGSVPSEDKLSAEQKKVTAHMRKQIGISPLEKRQLERVKEQRAMMKKYKDGDSDSEDVSSDEGKDVRDSIRMPTIGWHKDPLKYLEEGTFRDVGPPAAKKPRSINPINVTDGSGSSTNNNNQREITYFLNNPNEQLYCPCSSQRCKFVLKRRNMPVIETYSPTLFCRLIKLYNKFPNSGGTAEEWLYMAEAWTHPRPIPTEETLLLMKHCPAIASFYSLQPVQRS